MAVAVAAKTLRVRSSSYSGNERPFYCITLTFDRAVLNFTANSKRISQQVEVYRQYKQRERRATCKGWPLLSADWPTGRAAGGSALSQLEVQQQQPKSPPGESGTRIWPPTGTHRASYSF